MSAPIWRRLFHGLGVDLMLGPAARMAPADDKPAETAAARPVEAAFERD